MLPCVAHPLGRPTALTFMVGSFSTRGRQYTGTGTFFIRVSSWPPFGLSCNHKAEAAWARGPGLGAPLSCPTGPSTRPTPPVPCAPCSTCLYLAGRLQPQACSRPSSLRTCSRTWRYCSRFCSRRAEDVQSLGRRQAGHLPLGPAGRPARSLPAPSSSRPAAQPLRLAVRTVQCSCPPSGPVLENVPSSNMGHTIPHFCPGAKILVPKLKENTKFQTVFSGRSPALLVTSCRLQTSPGSAGVLGSLGAARPKGGCGDVPKGRGWGLPPAYPVTFRGAGRGRRGRPPCLSLEGGPWHTQPPPRPPMCRPAGEAGETTGHSLIGEELQRSAASRDLAHRVAAALAEAGCGGRLVMDVH